MHILGIRTRALLLGIVATTALHAALASTAPPSNDSFATPHEVTGAWLSYFHAQSSAGATMEPGEPAPCRMGASVWFRVGPTSGFLGPMVVEAGGSTFPTAIAVYTGPDLERLTLVDCIGNPGDPPVMRFTALPTEVYYIQVGGVGGATGRLVFQAY